MRKTPRDTFDWKNFEEFFGGKLPFMQMENGVPSQNWVEDYVQGILRNIPTTAKKNNLLKHDIFQTHNFVFIKVAIPQNVNIRDLQVSVSPNQIMIEGLPENQHHVIKLPEIVKFRDSKAKFKDGILQIKVRKNIDDQKFHDVYISYE
ncbi:Hsp20/alpha crystallin family protein [Paenibacillus terrigena]|uniref:Hsp20/alpha crystallin family protein n=1 Tax=Paenibacillus terrigena TaxID=369333 RepID=UPI0028D72AC3|nr:Hsp20/alpha crystallin family protein [Paenibacillus terrigena]